DRDGAADGGLALGAQQRPMIDRLEGQHLAFGCQRGLDLRDRRAGSDNQRQRAWLVEADAGEAARGQRAFRLHRAAERSSRAATCNLERGARSGGLGHDRRKLRLVGGREHGHAARRPSETESGKTLAGFSSQRGSNTSFTSICAARSAGAYWWPIRSRFSTPTPCSPVRQPPTSTQSFRISAPSASAFSSSPGTLASWIIS